MSLLNRRREHRSALRVEQLALVMDLPHVLAEIVEDHLFLYLAPGRLILGQRSKGSWFQGKAAISWYPAVVKKESPLAVLVHFQGWPARCDEWIDKDSKRLAVLDLGRFTWAFRFLLIHKATWT